MYKRFERANESPHSLSHGLVLRLVEQSQTGTGRISRRPNVSGRGASYYYSRIKKQAAGKVNIELILFAAYLSQIQLFSDIKSKVPRIRFILVLRLLTNRYNNPYF